MGAIARFRNYQDLIAFLTENNVPFKAEPDKLSAHVQVGDPNQVSSVHIRWERDLPLVQIVFPFVADVPAARVSEVETAICRVNNTIKLPGFGLEYDHLFVYMRLAVQLQEDGISAPLFQRQVYSVIQNASEFVGAFRDVVAGAPGKEILALALKHNQPK
jgi:hypothetical protein